MFVWHRNGAYGYSRLQLIMKLHVTDSNGTPCVFEASSNARGIARVDFPVAKVSGETRFAKLVWNFDDTRGDSRDVVAATETEDSSKNQKRKR